MDWLHAPSSRHRDKRLNDGFIVGLFTGKGRDRIEPGSFAGGHKAESYTGHQRATKSTDYGYQREPYGNIEQHQYAADMLEVRQELSQIREQN